jgi:hypothetical protein
MPRDKRSRKMLRRFRKIDKQGEQQMRWARERKFRKAAQGIEARRVKTGAWCSSTRARWRKPCALIKAVGEGQVTGPRRDTDYDTPITIPLNPVRGVTRQI